MWPFYVRRQGDLANRLEVVLYVALVALAVEPYSAVALRGFLLNVANDAGGVLLQVFEQQRSSGPNTLAGTDHRPPIVLLSFFHQKHFHQTACFRLGSAETGGNNFGIIQHDDVAI